MNNIIIIGSGITGLTIGRELQKREIDFKIFDSKENIGGKIETTRICETNLQTKPTKPNLPNQTYQRKSNLAYQAY